MLLLFLAILILVIIAIGLYLSTHYNTYLLFQTLRNREKQELAHIKLLLTQRLHLIKELATVTTDYKDHEYKTQHDVATARSKVGGSGINIVIEQPPKLEASELHKSLMGKDNISDIEQRIKDGIQTHNYTVLQHNRLLTTIMGLIVARKHNFTTLDLYTFDGINYDGIKVFE